MMIIMMIIMITVDSNYSISCTRNGSDSSNGSNNSSK